VRSSVILDGWQDVPLARLIGEATSLPCQVDNDVNTGALAELAARGGGPRGGMLFATIGTGIGGAIVIDGELWRGASGIAGEIGHTSVARDGDRCWCGRRGCLVTVSSGSAIERALGAEPGTLEELAASGDRRVEEALEAAAWHLGFGIGDALNLLNPALVVLGGGVVELGEPFLRRVARTARQQCFAEAAEACSFELARAGYDAGAVGAALMVM